MYKFILLSLVGILMTTTLSAQDTWKTLGKISFKKQYDDLMGFDVDVPVFSKDVMALQGKEIEIKGYMIPSEKHGMQSTFIFSAFPYAMCFFCGNAGPETVMEVYTEGKPIKFTSKPVKLRGILQLNSGNINNLMYILNDAVLVSE